MLLGSFPLFSFLLAFASANPLPQTGGDGVGVNVIFSDPNDVCTTGQGDFDLVTDPNGATNLPASLPLNGELTTTGLDDIIEAVYSADDRVPVQCSFLNDQGEVVVTLQAGQKMAMIQPPQALPSGFCESCPAGVP